MKNTARFLTLLLMLCLLIGAVSCTNPPVSDPGTGTPEVTEPITEPDTTPEEPPEEWVVLSQEYVLVLNATHAKGSALAEAAAYVQEALASVYGITATVTSDSTAEGEVVSPGAYEILIGETNRPQSAEAIEGLGVNDYTYLVESEQVIVICGGSLASTKQAAEKFCADVLGYTEEAEALAKTPVLIGASDTYEEQYSCTEATLNGTPLAEYTIALADTRAKAVDTAFSVARLLGIHSGERIPVVSAEELTGEEKALILFDAIGRELTPFAEFDGYYYNIGADDVGPMITLASNEKFYGPMLSKISIMLQTETENGVAALTLSVQERIYHNKVGNLPTWTRATSDSSILCDGMVYSEKLFMDDSRLPYRMYILNVDPAKINIHLGTTNDSTSLGIAPEDIGNVVEHAQAAVANGKNIVAAVNAGFFNINTDYTPTWLAIKDGVIMGTGNPGPAFFAVTDSGEIIIDYGKNYANYSDRTIVTAISGSSLILLDGQITEQAHANDTHPRTLVGIKEDGTLIFAVIDGRQREHSNGASLLQCAVWMNTLGATTVLNLDGGGSSTFVTRDVLTDSYTVHNSPSDGTLRNVHDSLLFEPKTEE